MVESVVTLDYRVTEGSSLEGEREGMDCKSAFEEIPCFEGVRTPACTNYMLFAAAVQPDQPSRNVRTNWVKVLYILALLFVGPVCGAQGKRNLVYGNYSKYEIVSSIHFEEVGCACRVLKIDNMKGGNPFPIYISEKRIVGVDDFWDPDTTLVNKGTLDTILDFAKRNHTHLDTIPFGLPTFRIIYRDDSTTERYYVIGYANKEAYFTRLADIIAGTGKHEKLVSQLKSIAASTRR